MRDEALSECLAETRARYAAFGQAILKHSVWFIALFQAALVFCGLLAAWLLRFNFFLPDLHLMLSLAPVLIAIRLIAITQFGLMHGWWRYTGFSDAIALLKATVAGSIVFVVCVRVMSRNAAFPRTVYLLEPLVNVLLLAGVRIFSRIVAESLRRERAPAKRVILIGAGGAAQATLREIASHGSGYQAVACVDDDDSKIGVEILGIPVVGTVQQLPALSEKLGIRECLIAMPSATPHQLQRIADICSRARIEYKILPTLRGILNGFVDLSPFQDANVENLLGRDPVKIDLEIARTLITGQTVLVTGAAGTIGSELSRQVLHCHPRKLICLDRNETGTFYLQMELATKRSETQLIFCVTDFGDAERMQSVLREHTPSVIFHAAAYKHVPMMEANVYDAVKNNILGLLELLQISEKSGCLSFVLISSDKAVNPTNVMGATKRVGELIVASRPAGPMRCVSVRFGNVLGSNGSVVPILQKQLRDRRRLTITHPAATRFFMTTQEAVSLVLQAFAIGNHSDTLLLEMGRAVSILDLARTLIRLSGKSEREVEICFTGLRDGEKLFEEMAYSTEEIRPTSSARIGRIRGTPQGWPELSRRLDGLRHSLYTRSDRTIREKVKEIVPEYSPRGGNETALPSNSEPARDPVTVVLNNSGLQQNSREIFHFQDL